MGTLPGGRGSEGLAEARAAAHADAVLVRLQVLNYLGNRWKKHGKACMKPGQAEAVLGHSAFNEQAGLLATKFIGSLRARLDDELPPAEE